MTTETPSLSGYEKMSIIRDLITCESAQLSEALIAATREVVKDDYPEVDLFWDPLLLELVKIERQLREKNLHVSADLQQAAIAGYVKEAGLRNFRAALSVTPDPIDIRLYAELRVKGRLNTSHGARSSLNLTSRFLILLTKYLNIKTNSDPIVKAEIQGGVLYWQLINPQTKEVLYDRQLARRKPEFNFTDNSWEMSWENFSLFLDTPKTTPKDKEVVFVAANGKELSRFRGCNPDYPQALGGEVYTRDALKQHSKKLSNLEHIPSHEIVSEDNASKSDASWWGIIITYQIKELVKSPLFQAGDTWGNFIRQLRSYVDILKPSHIAAENRFQALSLGGFRTLWRKQLKTCETDPNSVPPHFLAFFKTHKDRFPEVDKILNDKAKELTTPLTAASRSAEVRVKQRRV